MKRPRSGFTLIELLVVVSIIALLVALLLPVFSKARESAVAAECMSDKRQIVNALQSYARDNDGYYPSRNPNSGYGYPHQMRRTSNGPYDLNEPFIIPYIGDRAFLFCPGLPTTPADLNDNWATTQYHNFPKNVFWIVPRPDLSSVEEIKGRAPLWSCFARIKQGRYTTHGRNNVTEEPEGMVSAFSDGAARWVPWDETEGYWAAGEVHYWPIYRE